MRLLQLATGPDEILDLHPNVTIVAGLDEVSHAALVAAVAGLARSEVAVGGGLLEAHGVLFDLDPSLLSLVEQAEDDLDPIVHPGQLPTQPVSVDARVLRAREETFAALLEQIAAQAEQQSLARDTVSAAATAVETARQARADAEAGAAHRLDDVDRLTRQLDLLAEQGRRLGDELSEVRSALHAAQTTRAEVELRTASVREAKDAAVARRSAVEAQLAEVDAALDHTAGADAERAADALRKLEADLEAERLRGPAEPAETSADGAEQLAQRLERLDERRHELEGLLAVLTPTERIAIEEGVAMLLGGDATDLVPSADGAALADDLDRIAAELGDPGSDGVGEVDTVSVAEARVRLDDARQALLEAEQTVRNPDVDQEAVRQLEGAHADLLGAMDKADSRFGGSRARDRVSQLRIAEQEVLDRLGYTSYSDYMMGSSLLDPEKGAALDAARADLETAEDEWRRLERATEAALERASLLDRRRTLLEQAQRLLGRAAPGGRPQEALRALLVPTVSTRESAQLLQASLETVGVGLGDEELDDEELVIIAEAWLDEADQADTRRQQVLEERASLEAERGALVADLAAAGGLVDAAGGSMVVPDPEERRQHLLAEARAELLAAEDRREASQATEELRTAVATDLAAAQDAERSAVAAAADADSEMAAALATEDPLAGRLEELEDEQARADHEAAEADAALRRLAEAPDPAELAAALDSARARQVEARARVEVEDRALAALDAEGRAAALEIEGLQDIVAAQGTGTATPAEELEWYLLARLAAQRSVSVAGSLPLLLDDALRGLDGSEVGHLLDRLERMAEAVQVIVISDDPLVASWAVQAGSARAAVVSPVAP